MIFVSLVGLLACGGEAPVRDTGPSVPVETTPAKPRPFASAEVFVGNIESRNAVTISTKMMGRIQRIAVSEGDAVKRGQLLVEVDASEARNAYRQSKAGIDAAEVRVRNMERDLARFQALFEQRAVTQHQLEQVEAGLADARTQAAQARANLEMAEAQLSYGRILAPEDGLVTRKWMDEGNLAGPGAPLLSLETPDALELTVSVPGEKALRLAPGQGAEVKADALARTFTTTIRSVVPAADPVSRTSSAKLALPGDAELRPGQFVRVRFAALGGESLAVPEGAVVRQGQMDGVYLVEEGIARLRWIRTGRTAGGHVEVLAGLREGEPVVNPVPPGLRDGRPVEVAR